MSAIKDSILNIAKRYAGDFVGPELTQLAAGSRAAALRHLPTTESGFPRLRPPECAALIADLDRNVKRNLHLIQAGDRAVTDNLLRAIRIFAASDIRSYPSQLLALRIVEAKVHLAANDVAGVRSAVGFWLDRPHAAETGARGLANLFWLEGQVALIEGTAPSEIAATAQRRVRYLARARARDILGLVYRFSPMLALSNAREARLKGHQVFVHWAAQVVVRARRPYARLKRLKNFVPGVAAAIAGAAVLAVAAAWVPSRAKLAEIFRFDAITADDVLVTRAMGGVGDLIMMTAGLRALSKRYGAKIRMAVPARFFPVFENNPHVELLDLDKAPLDTSSFRIWRNLTQCPAARRESVRAPYVRRGRVRLFAAGMGVKRRELDRHGHGVEVHLSDEARAYAGDFLSLSGFGARTVIGVQPYSRDSYKDHPGMVDIIRKLALEFDVVVFHHARDGVPTGPGIASTASLELSQSLALAAEMAAIVSVDSAFMHAAAAFDVPVVALFGPTNGHVVMEHYAKKVVVDMAASFPCMPCWRNEDLPCRMTNQTGTSPCMTAIKFEPIRAALDKALAMRDPPDPAERADGAADEGE